jgi:hypothetical protein
MPVLKLWWALLLCALLMLPGVAAATPPVREAAVPTTQEPAPTPTPSTIDAAESVAGPLANGGFERGALSGWEADAGVTLSAAQLHSGAWAVCLNNAALRSTWLAVQPGAAYKLTAWVKIIDEQLTGDDAWGGFNVRVYDFAWQTLVQSDALLTATHGEQWFKVALPFTATTSAAVLDLGYFGGSGRRMTVCVDDVTLLRTQANRPPVITAALTPLTLGGLPAMQRFTLTGDDPDGAIVRVLWDFGDGGRALAWQGERRVALPGIYTATVTVADDDGAVITQQVRWRAAAAPTITLLTPITDHTVVTTVTLPLTGVASGGVTQVTVSTDRDVAVVAQGAATWRADLPLQPGANRILVQAHDAAGRVATVERIVRYVPPGALRITAVAYPASGERWDPLEITFALAGSAATHPHLPFDAAPPPGLAWVDGVSVNATFTAGDGRTSYTRPAFLQQRYMRALKSGQEWLYPQGAPVWTVRFAPPEPGTWTFRIAAQEAKGAATSDVYTFTVTAPANPENHGPIAVAAQDSRYFEFADGTPFLGAGHGVGFDAEAFSYAAADLFDEIGAGNQNLFRWWISGALWGSAWQPWRSRTLESDGYLPATGLTLDRAYGDGLAALRLDAANPVMFYGFDSGRPGLIVGRTYRLRVRWRTEGIVSAMAGQPFGVTLKFTGWPEVGDTARFPALIAHVAGDTPWHIAEAEFTATGDFFDQYLTLVLENAQDGAAYIDAVTLQEVLADGTPGAQLLRNPRANSHLTFDDRRAAGIDAILAEANRRGFYFKLVISEKNEWLLNHLGPEGLPDALGGHFDAAAGSAGRWLHAAYWRYLAARYGAFRAVHSWELANETAPGFGDNFRLAAALATFAAADGNPHLASTSTWATLAEDAWTHPASAPLGYVDFHAYVNGTGWLEPKAGLAEDSAGFFAAYDRAAREAAFGKPVVWGEMGIDSAESTDREEPRLADDADGVWLHKLTWARLGPGGVTPLYWYTDNIYTWKLHAIFGAWRRFMAGIPLTNGRYVDAGATVSNPGLRAFGQKDITDGQAHLWIDNRAHTWFNVVNGAPIPAVSGVVTVNLGAPRAGFTVTWFDTRTGLSVDTEIITADAAGSVRLTVENLATDRAVKLARSK